jgi:hypothetical protein
MSTTGKAQGFDERKQFDIAQRAVGKRSFCVLATSSAANRPHAVGILYAPIGMTLYLLVSEDSVKTRNVRENPNVAVSIPVRQLPLGPPLAVQFQGTAEVLPVDDPHIVQLRSAGRLKKILTADPTAVRGVCVLRVVPRRRISTYGLGVPLRKLLRDPSCGHRSVRVPDDQTA